MNEMPMTQPLPASIDQPRRSLSSSRQNGWRRFKDRFATGAISVGGMSVLVAILLIFFYLLYEVVPMFRSASAEPVASYAVTGLEAHPGQPLFLTMEEQAEIGMRLDSTGEAVFFATADGRLVNRHRLPLPAGAGIESFALEAEQSQLLALGLSDGSALLFKPNYVVTYPDDKRLITPELSYPYGEQPLQLAEGAPLRQLTLRDGSSGLVLIAATDHGLVARKWEKKQDFLTGESTLSEVPLQLPAVDIPPARLLISPDQRVLYVLSRSGDYRVIDLMRSEQIDSGRLIGSGEINDARFLLGGISLLVASSHGEVSQWSLVRRPDVNPQLVRMREFDVGSRDNPVQQLAVEHRRKNFVTVDGGQELELFNATGERRSLSASLGKAAVTALGFAPRANALLFETADGQLHFWRVHNEHPEVSLKALWGKVWYESYPEPDYVWHSSSASSEYEPKYRLTPLAFGTLKAAFYAMIFAAPLAICGAIYTAYFMAPALRRKIKPLIELMSALPTVIIGFLAGLWLAPFMEKHLPGVFSLLVLTPIAVLLFAFAWNQVPIRLRKWVPDGWEPLLLAPVVVLVALACIGMSGAMERTFFGGDMRAWFTNDLGIAFDQRNAMVVGVAMGFAVIPVIFSIAEDAIFSVPKHLSFGSLALGATPWQTLVGVVLPTASPGIFSALMIGLGRAVGETMIVLMATGNTPVMEVNIFEGMRTLAANLAVEVGETEVGSTHYRVLFLAAFVLFTFTFVVNTLAEAVRQRLRRRYSVI
jgi:phosphate transport system permease protein